MNMCKNSKNIPNLYQHRTLHPSWNLKLVGKTMYHTEQNIKPQKQEIVDTMKRHQLTCVDQSHQFIRKVQSTNSSRKRQKQKLVVIMHAWTTTTTTATSFFASPHHSLFSLFLPFHDMITTCRTSSTTNLGGAQPLSLRFLSKPAPFLSLSFFFPYHSANNGIAVSSTQCKPRIRCDKEVGNGNNNGIEEDEEAEREVQCEVQVVSWRERRVKAEIPVNADIESVWNALTDYDHLADFIPNLVWR